MCVRSLHHNVLCASDADDVWMGPRYGWVSAADDMCVWGRAGAGEGCSMGLVSAADGPWVVDSVMCVEGPGAAHGMGDDGHSVVCVWDSVDG